jgi:hypothetical protein
MIIIIIIIIIIITTTTIIPQKTNLKDPRILISYTRNGVQPHSGPFSFHVKVRKLHAGQRYRVCRLVFSLQIHPEIGHPTRAVKAKALPLQNDQ